MQYHRRTEDQQQFALFDPPIPLDAGKLDVKQASAGYLLSGGLFASGMVCLVLVAVIFPPADGTGAWFGWRVVGATLLAVPMGLSFWTSLETWMSVRRGFKDYDAFLFDVRQMWLDAAEDLRGQPALISHVEEEGFAIDLPHVLTMALAITWDLNQQRGEQRKLWTVEALQGAAYVAVPEGNGEAYLHFGKLSKPMAEQLGQVFARLGLIEGRRERAAGRWTAADANDTVETVLLNWKRAGLPLTGIATRA